MALSCAPGTCTAIVGDDGVTTFHLDADSQVVLILDAFATSREEFAEMQAFADAHVPWTPNPFNPRGPPVRRKQATFGATYDFGQHSASFDATTAPVMVKTAQRLAQSIIASPAVHATNAVPSDYAAVHVNWYADGASALAQHSDDEPCHQAGAPIISFTALEDAAKPRTFRVTNLRGETVLELDLLHGSACIMQGRMQERFKHGIVKTTKQGYKHGAGRINLTIRAFREQTGKDGRKRAEEQRADARDGRKNRRIEDGRG